VLPSETLVVVEAILRGSETAAVIARASAGLVYSYWEANDASMLATLGRLRRQVGAIGGAVVVEKAPASLLHGLDAWGIEGADVALMRRVKDAYDPRGVLSPGRLV
jgi:glycolate oxidase FAD binding subunit